MKTLKIYDPAMCCSSGVCGTSVDDKLVQLSNFIKGLDEKECSVERYNLSQEPSAYTENCVVATTLQEKGVEALPLVFVNDELIASGEYPSTERLAELLGCESSDGSASSCCCSGGCC